MKYIIYARKSTEDKGRQILSLESQVDTMKELADNLGLKVVKILTESKSAKKPNNRPVFSEMMKMLEKGKANGIICWKLDRLSRNPIDSGRIQWLLQEDIIKEIQTNERRYLPDDNALIYNVESGMANQYIRDLSKNVKRGIKTKLEKGGYPNYAKIGYANDRLNKTIIPDGDRSEYIKRAYDLYATGSHSLEEVTNILYREGFRSRGGNKYAKSKIHMILQDPFYYGVMRVNGKYYNGNHQPLLSKNLFDKVQDIFNNNNRSRYKKHFFPLRGFMTCNKCGCLLTAIKKKGFTYYYCTNGKKQCEEHKHYLKSEDAEEILSPIFENIQFSDEFIELCYQADIEQNQNNEDYSENAKSNLEKSLEMLAQKESKLLDAQIDGKYAKSTIEAKLEALNKEAIDTKQQLKDLERLSPETGVRTLEQTKKIFLSPYLSKKDFTEGDDLKKRKALENLLLNASIENKEMACYKLKQPYHILEKVDDKTDFVQMRRGRDLNPGTRLKVNTLAVCRFRPLSHLSKNIQLSSS